MNISSVKKPVVIGLIILIALTILINLEKSQTPNNKTKIY